MCNSKASNICTYDIIQTNDKSLLVECKVKMVENENLSEDEAPYVTLKPVHNELKGDLTLHIL